MAALMWVAWAGRRELVAVGDGLAAASMAGLAMWHTGCLPRDACLGTESDLPWAVAQAGSTITRHPVELYAAVAFALVAVVIAWRRPLAGGVASAVALVAAGAVRLFTEPLRPSLAGGPVGWYIAAIAAGLVLLVWLWVRRQERLRSFAAE